MATLTKSRARKPLASAWASWSWSANAEDDGGRYNASLYNVETGHRYQTSLHRSEALGFVGFIAAHETFVFGYGPGAMGTSDKRTLPEKLRALADKLEAEGTTNG